MVIAKYRPSNHGISSAYEIFRIYKCTEQRNHMTGVWSKNPNKLRHLWGGFRNFDECKWKVQGGNFYYNFFPQIACLDPNN